VQGTFDNRKARQMTSAKMINRRVSKGYNREESIELLNEVMSTNMNEEVRIATLLYYDFISLYTAQKEMAVA
jgi:hypothetical protein